MPATEVPKAVVKTGPGYGWKVKCTESYYVWGDESDEGLELESSGDICLLQRYRYSTFANRDTPPPYPTDLKGLLQTEVALRENTQREIALKEKIEELAKEDTYATVVQDLQEELSTLSKEYWTLERRWWEIRSSYCDGPLARGIEFWRSQPKWYMHRVLVEDCVGRGGCCGRDCGCCSHRQSERKFAVGHCTVECSCCERARGFALDPEQKSQLRETFKLDCNRPRAWYYDRMRTASLLGLMAGNYENPLNLIVDVPPRYTAPSEESQGSKWKNYLRGSSR
ncbi:Pc22g14590 [Penicillium rubens Wisconsin 54-1255]|uniref:Pc22g14590 protein n=1 Tax=Penicillium rubens (strain ATCC 28089 / DSM 1075 / NRRL 1951 / Wisconsin 54-1255) TaxID=500485 RepID=B6HUZ6_PENRW|nr:Pc22g14590 [Penicillium rubens Wisconsin 54-1255]